MLESFYSSLDKGVGILNLWSSISIFMSLIFVVSALVDKFSF